MDYPPPSEKIRSKTSLKFQEWTCCILVLPFGIAGLFSLILWSSLLIDTLFPAVFKSVPSGRHDVMELALWTLPALILTPFVFSLLVKASRAYQRDYNTLITGTVVFRLPETYEGHAKVKGVNRAGQPLVQTLRVPIDNWSTLKVGDPYPWQ